MSVCSPEALDLVLSWRNKMRVFNLNSKLIHFWRSEIASMPALNRVADCVCVCFDGAVLSGGGGGVARR